MKHTNGQHIGLVAAMAFASLTATAKEAVWLGLSSDWADAANWDNNGSLPAGAGNQGVEFDATTAFQPVLGSAQPGGSYRLQTLTFKTAGWNLSGTGPLTLSKAGLNVGNNLEEPQNPYIRSSGEGTNTVAVPLQLVKPGDGHVQFVSASGNTLELGVVSFENDQTSNLDVTGGGTIRLTGAMSCGDFRAGGGSLVLLDCASASNPFPKSGKIRINDATLRWLRPNQACQGAAPITYLRIDDDGVADLNGNDETFQQVQFALDTTKAGTIDTGAGTLSLSAGNISVGSSSKEPASTATLRGTLARSGSGGFSFLTRRGTQEIDLLLDCDIEAATSCFFKKVDNLYPAGIVVMKGIYKANGKFQVDAGTLRFDNPGTIVFAGAEINVQAGARLEGAAVVCGAVNNSKSLTVTGTLSPGTEHGGLSVVENTLANGSKVMMPVTFKAASTLEIPSLAAGVVNFSTEGGVTVEQGATLDLSVLSNPAPGKYAVLHAERGITGEFAVTGGPSDWAVVTENEGRDICVKIPVKGMVVVFR